MQFEINDEIEASIRLVARQTGKPIELVIKDSLALMVICHEASEDGGEIILRFTNGPEVKEFRVKGIL